MYFDDSPRARSSVRAWPAALRIVCIFWMAACGGGEGSGVTGSNGINTRSTGSLAVTVTGLPAGAAAAIVVTGPSGFSRAVTASETLNDLAAGSYDVTASQVSTTADRFGVSPATQTTRVTARTTASTTVGYAILSGSLSVGFSGLPVGIAPNVTVTGPNGYSHTVTTAGTLAGLSPGTYNIAADAVVIDGRTFAPDVPTLQIAVTASATPAPAAFSYRLSSGALLVVIEGLPVGTGASAIVTGPNDFRRTVSSGDTLGNLSPGSYGVTADPVAVGVDTYRVSAPTRIDVEPSMSPVAASLRFSLATGRLSISLSGLPIGVNASVAVTGPSGFARILTAAQVLSGLAPGDYLITANAIVTSTASYAATLPSQHAAIVPATTAIPVGIDYAISTGSIAVSVNGLPQSVAAAVAVSGPNGYAASVSVTSTLSNLRPGSYTLTASSAMAGPHSYSVTPATLTVTVGVSSTAIPAVFTYALATGGIALNVTGLPINVLSDVTVTGPGGYSRSVTATALLLGLAPGTYTAAARFVQSGIAFWAPNPASQNIVVAPSISAVTAAVNYTTATGSLTVTVSGLGAGVNGSISVTGPNSYSRSIANTTTISGLVQGLYTVAATAVVSASTTYTPAAASQNVSIGGGASSSLGVTYTASGGPPPPPPPPAGFNLNIDGMHVQQVVQAYAGTVPLVAGRDGLLRVFVKASQSNSATPTVRVRFYSGSTLTSTITINAPGSSAATSITEGTLTSSWNYRIPGALIQPGLKILADVDPANTVTESSDSDNSFPTSGSALTMDVRTVPTFNMRFVPVLQSVNSLQGNVTLGNASQLLSDTRALFPLGSVDVDVRAPFTTNAPVLQSGDGNGAWNQILSEINALRTADGSSRYYYGVVKVGYGSGIAGLGYVPGRASIGWDVSGSAEGVMAHEVGHNFGRFHAPSCGAGGPDPSYPYAEGKIGVTGYNIATNALEAAAATYDLMGYCNNPVWISDYTYTAVLNYRATNPFTTAAARGGNYARPGLLVWGRVQNGQLILEPTFEVVAPPALPLRSGRNRIQGFGQLGESLFDFSFDGEQVADLPGAGAEHFAFVVPMDAMQGTHPIRLRLSAANLQTELRSTASGLAANDAPVAERSGTNTVRVTWRDATTRGVLVRDARSGQILAFARGGQATIYTRESTLELTTSDGVRSTRQRVTVAPAGARPPLR